ncbi:hypothetical protein GQ44DRAFT_825532 [Phaeosphaeriaceae sp. PMI808]|nr:hypothetical protein GQ44DRAFT_825532 [Phaeosphaeriaceae sp. PMI808]
MSITYDRTPLELIPELNERSDAEEMDLFSEEETTQKQFNNRRLIQAINYLYKDGADDSPVTFMSRVNLINDALLQQLPQQKRTFDSKLYRRLRDMVSKVQRDYEDAAGELLSQLDDDEDFFAYNTPKTNGVALHRAYFSSPPSTPTPVTGPSQARNLRSTASEIFDSADIAQQESRFSYGGPNNDVEIWYKRAPANLPVPETHMMAHWESLKMEYDLSHSGQKDIAETAVPIDHETLLPYLDLPRYESGSHFKLPLVGRNFQAEMSRYGTAAQLKKVVDEYNHENALEREAKHYVPRVFSEKFEVGNQVPPNVVHPNVVSADDLRRALNSSPSKAQTSSAWKSSSTSKRVTPNQIRRSLSATPSKACSSSKSNVDSPTNSPQVSLPPDLVGEKPATPTVANAKSHKSRSPRDSILISCTPKSGDRLSAAFRRIDDEVQQSIKTEKLTVPVVSKSKTPDSNVRPTPSRSKSTSVSVPTFPSIQSLFSGLVVAHDVYGSAPENTKSATTIKGSIQPAKVDASVGAISPGMEVVHDKIDPTSKKLESESTSSQSTPISTTPTPTNISTKTLVPKRGPGRPRKIPSPSEPSPQHPNSPPSVLGKRKPSVGSRPYSPPATDLKKSLRDAKRQKTVAFVDLPVALEEDSDDPNYHTIIVSRPHRSNSPAKSSKAKTAGRQVKREKMKRVPSVERVSVEEYERRMRKERTGVVAGVGGMARGRLRSGHKFR